ncbi:MAG: ABC transporter permease, partial [Planctomycetes bacterium]|nr:ABC transporter permease [Planctomycetota bacterium]
IDLSVGSTIALSGIAAALALRAEWGPAAAVAVAVATGTAVGLANGAIIVGARMMPFIVTLGMLGVARGLAKLLSGEQTVNFHGSWLDHAMQPFPMRSDPWILHALVVAPGVWLAAALALAMSVVMSRSIFGRHLYAIGSNEAAARLCGIRVRAVKVAAYALAGALTGVAGLLECTRLHQGDPSTAGGRELDVIAAVVIGGASLSGGTGTVGGAIIGALIMGVLRNGSQLLWSSSTQEIIIGVVIIVAVGIDRLRHRMQT